MAGHVSSIPVDIVEGAIESTSMDRMKAFSYIAYLVGLGLTNFFIDLMVGVFDELIQDGVGSPLFQ